MTESGGRIALRTAWGVILALVAPGVGLVFVRAWAAGLVLLALDEAVSLGALDITRRYAPERDPVLWVAGLLGFALLLRAGAVGVVLRRLRARAAPRGRWWRSTWLAAGVLAAATVAQDTLLPDFGWRSFSVPSGSMIPTLQVGDVFLADVRSPGERPVQGAVVVFAVGEPEPTIYVKRVIGLSGDRVAVRQGHLRLNDQPTPLRALPFVMTDDGEARRYVETLPSGRAFRMQKLNDDGPMNDTPDYIVPPGNMFLMGDNRDNSLDSRALALRDGGSFGFVPVPDVLGTAGMVFWPPRRALTRIE